MHELMIICFLFYYNKTSLKNCVFYYINLFAYIHLSFVILPTTHPELYITLMSIVQVIVVCSSPKAKTLSKPEPVQTVIKVCPQGIPVFTGFTVQMLCFCWAYRLVRQYCGEPP